MRLQVVRCGYKLWQLGISMLNITLLLVIVAVMSMAVAVYLGSAYSLPALGCAYCSGLLTAIASNYDIRITRS